MLAKWLTREPMYKLDQPEKEPQLKSKIYLPQGEVVGHTLFFNGLSKNLQIVGNPVLDHLRLLCGLKGA